MSTCSEKRDAGAVCRQPAGLDDLQQAALLFLRAALAQHEGVTCNCAACVGPANSAVATIALLAKTDPFALAADAIALATACIDDAAAQLYVEAKALQNAPSQPPCAPWPTVQ